MDLFDLLMPPAMANLKNRLQNLPTNHCLWMLWMWPMINLSRCRFAYDLLCCCYCCDYCRCLDCCYGCCYCYCLNWSMRLRPNWELNLWTVGNVNNLVAFYPKRTLTLLIACNTSNVVRAITYIQLLLLLLVSTTTNEYKYTNGYMRTAPNFEVSMPSVKRHLRETSVLRSSILYFGWSFRLLFQ